MQEYIHPSFPDKKFATHADMMTFLSSKAAERCVKHPNFSAICGLCEKIEEEVKLEQMYDASLLKYRQYDELLRLKMSNNMKMKQLDKIQEDLRTLCDIRS